MTDNHVKIELKIVATIGERKYESTIDTEHDLRINGIRVINYLDVQDAMKVYILRTCGDEEILSEITKTDIEKREIVYNPNLSSEMADALADELCHVDEGGAYPYEFCVILRNPRVSGKKLDFFANHFLEQYHDSFEDRGGKPNYELMYLLRYIAQNPAVWESTLETLKRSNIPMVVEAAKR